MAGNENLKWLSTQLLQEWEDMAEYLGIRRSRRQSIKRNNPDDPEEQIFTMLTTWRGMTKKSDDKDKILCDALTKCGRIDLVAQLKHSPKEPSD